jgi:hypothetical protein
MPQSGQWQQAAVGQYRKLRASAAENPELVDEVEPVDAQPPQVDLLGQILRVRPTIGAPREKGDQLPMPLTGRVQ